MTENENTGNPFWDRNSSRDQIKAMSRSLFSDAQVNLAKVEFELFERISTISGENHELDRREVSLGPNLKKEDVSKVAQINCRRLFNDFVLIEGCEHLKECPRVDKVSYLSDYLEVVKPQWLGGGVDLKDLTREISSFRDWEIEDFKEDFVRLEKVLKGKGIITLSDLFSSFYERAKKSRNFCLSESEYLLTAAVWNQILQKGIPEAKNDLEMMTILFFTVPLCILRPEMEKYLPPKLIKGETPSDIFNRKNRTISVIRLINDFVCQTVDSLQDIDDPKHEMAKNFIRNMQPVSEELVAEVCLNMEGDGIKDMNIISWIKNMEENYQDTGDIMYQVLARVAEKYKPIDASTRFFRADFLNSHFMNMKNGSNQKELENVIINYFAKLLTMNDRGKYQIVLRTKDVNLPSDRYPWADFVGEAAFSISLDNGWGSLLMYSPDDSRYTYWTFDIQPDSFSNFHLDVIDSEDVSSDLTNKLLLVTKDAISILVKELETEASANQRKEGNSIVKPIPAKEKGPSRTLPKETKRNKNENGCGQTESKHMEALAGMKMHQRLSLNVPKNLSFKDEETAQNFERAIRIYREGGGIAKIIKYRETESGNRILSLRVGRGDRVIFEIKGTEAEFLYFYHRDKQDDVLAGFKKVGR